MDNNYPELNIEKYSNKFNEFQNSFVSILLSAHKNNILKYFVSDDIYNQFFYSENRRKGSSLFNYLDEIFFSENKTFFLSFVNSEILPRSKRYLEIPIWELPCKVSERSDLIIISNLIYKLISQTNNSNVFNLDFYFDQDSYLIKRKLDTINTNSINTVIDNMSSDNKVRYEDCVSEFLSYKNNQQELFYNSSLNKLKTLIENTLSNYHKNENGTSPKISETKWISDIILKTKNEAVTNLLDYIVKFIHHESEGKPIKYTEKEYIYLWLELNNILFLLSINKPNQINTEASL